MTVGEGGGQAMAIARGTRRAFGAGLVIGVLSSAGALQVAPIIADSVAGLAAALPASSLTDEYRAVDEPGTSITLATPAFESATDEYRRSYEHAGAGDVSSPSSTPMSSTDEYRAMYEDR
jgi:hypothetical protein